MLQRALWESYQKLNIDCGLDILNFFISKIALWLCKRIAMS